MALSSLIVHEESKLVQQQALASFMSDGSLNGTNLAIPIIGSSEKKVNQWIDKLTNAGYDIYVHHVEVSNQESMNRSVARAIKTGRHVPLKIIKEYKEFPKKVFEKLKKQIRKGVTFQ